MPEEKASRCCLRLSHRILGRVSGIILDRCLYERREEAGACLLASNQVQRPVFQDQEQHRSRVDIILPATSRTSVSYVPPAQANVNPTLLRQCCPRPQSKSCLDQSCSSSHIICMHVRSSPHEYRPTRAPNALLSDSKPVQCDSTLV